MTDVLFYYRVDQALRWLSTHKVFHTGDFARELEISLYSARATLYTLVELDWVSVDSRSRGHRVNQSGSRGMKWRSRVSFKKEGPRVPAPSAFV